jgi:hypothetical protein
MGIEYYLVDNKEKKYFFLGKGNWGSGYGDSKLLTNLVSLEKTLEFVMETAFRGRGLEGEKLLAKMLFENFNSSDISDLE